MIKRVKKICKDCQTPQYLFSGGRCKRCDSIERRKRAIDVSNIAVERRSPLRCSKVPLKGQSRLKRRSQKRQMEEALYANASNRIRREQTHCFFCGEEITKRQVSDIHHLKGRDGELIFDDHYLVHVHRKCHSQYHFNSIHTWMWLDGFLERIRIIDEKLYWKEENKLSK